jgi:TATA-box binding protein (TBP) (component of TFIID and TFIIIB)
MFVCYYHALFVSVAQIFSKVTAMVTGPNNVNDMKGTYENFIKDLASLKSRK